MVKLAFRKPAKSLNGLDVGFMVLVLSFKRLFDNSHNDFIHPSMIERYLLKNDIKLKPVFVVCKNLITAAL